MSADVSLFRAGPEQLLSPISTEHPAGESLRYEGTYDRIYDARREDDPALSQGIYTTALKRANWETVETLCLEALETRTKDLQIAAWLMEAWLHQRGFAGVREGLKLLAGLCENFWPDLYPKLDEENAEARVSPVVWINEKLAVELKLIPITSPQMNDVASYSYAAWESACYQDNLLKRNPANAPHDEAAGSVTQADFHASFMLTQKSFYLTLAQDLNSTLDACLALGQILDERCKEQSPSLHLFKETLAEIGRLTAEILRARQDEAHPLDGFQETQFAVEEQEPETEVLIGNPIRSRKEAYQRLSEAADYLLRTEPHSPTPYLVKRAIAWEHMSLFELYRQIVRN
ncbi:MAG TPA: type VI secretion system protein TssA, partial [Pyrinomonadaceae bacterium]|nr:type VI secretion system protein TssA [Pyrinomonadaceae bacterium]